MLRMNAQRNAQIIIPAQTKIFFGGNVFSILAVNAFSNRKKSITNINNRKVDKPTNQICRFGSSKRSTSTIVFMYAVLLRPVTVMVKSTIRNSACDTNVLLIVKLCFSKVRPSSVKTAKGRIKNRLYSISGKWCSIIL